MVRETLKLVGTRLTNHQGTTWRETYYTEGGWGSSLRAMIKWQAQQAVAFNDTELSANTPISMVFSPDLTHLWTACLDHTLKVWNVRTGKLAIHMDLGGDMSRDLRKAAERLLAPNHAQLIKIIPSRNEEHFTVAVFSPKNQAVKFWTVRDVEAAAYGMEDARPDFEFVLPVEDLVDANVWTLESFEVKAPTRQDEPWELWILVRSGLQCHVYTIDFRFNDHLEGLKRLWGHNWTAVACANNTHNLKHNPENPSDLDPSYFLASPEGPVELWTKFLFHPGRFTESTLETALAIYRRSLGRDVQRDLQQSFSKDKSIQERISEAVGTFISLGQVGGVVAYEKYQHEIAAQWQIFYGVVKDLHKRREDLLSLCLDPVDDIPWVVTADQVSPLRKSAEVELLWYNRKTFACPESFQPRNPLLEALTDSRNSKVGQFFNAIAVFKNTFSKPFLFSLRTILKSEVLRSGRADTSQQIESLYSRSGFANQVTDDDYNVLKASLEPLGGFAQLDGDTIYTILQLLDETQKGRTQKNQLTKYGSRFLITGARETLQYSYEIVVDALLLVIFAAVELEQGDMPEEFDTHLVFEALMQKAKEYELLEYLSSTLRQESSEAPQPHHNPLDSTNGNGAENGASATTSITLLEALFIGDWASMMFPQGAEVDLLTYSCRAWTFGARLYEQYDVIASHVFGNLLKSGDRELAFEFLRFLPDTAWSQYLRARMHLTRNEFVEAFVYFERAAPELGECKAYTLVRTRLTNQSTIATGKYFDIEQFDSAHLLGPHERMQMNDGLAHYYSHILALFETARVMSYVADTAELALRSYDMEDTQEPALKTELLSRLFTASIQTSRFNTAFNTLIQYTDFALFVPVSLPSSAATNTYLQTQIRAPHAPHSSSIRLANDPPPLFTLPRFSRVRSRHLPRYARRQSLLLVVPIHVHSVLPLPPHGPTDENPTPQDPLRIPHQPRRPQRRRIVSLDAPADTTTTARRRRRRRACQFRRRRSRDLGNIPRAHQRAEPGRAG